jgi:hypothetical protein
MECCEAGLWVCMCECARLSAFVHAQVCVSVCASGSKESVKHKKHTAQRTPSDARPTPPPPDSPPLHTQRADQDSVPHLRSPRRRAHVCFSSLPRRGEAALTAQAATAADNTSRLQADARQHRRTLCSLGGSRSQAPPPNRSFLVPASPGEAMYESRALCEPNVRAGVHLCACAWACSRV